MSDNRRAVDHYDEYYLGDLRTVCWLPYFHFATKKELSNITVKELTDLLKDQSGPITKSCYPSNVDFDDMRAILEEQGLELKADRKPMITHVINKSV